MNNISFLHDCIAGLTIRANDFKQFTAEFECIAKEWLTQDQLERVFVTDGPYFAANVAIDDVYALQHAVWGQGFPAPQFDESVTVLDQRTVGAKHSKLRVARAGAPPVTALLWNHVAPLPSHIHVVYRWSVNSFNGNESAEMMIEAWRFFQGDNA